MSKQNVVEITDQHKSESKIINILNSTLRSLSATFGFNTSPDGKRDYNAIFGYGEILGYTDFYGMYKRSGMGNTVVGKVAKACWNEIPAIKQNDNQILEDELKELSKLGFFSALQRADVLNRIGSFSVLLIGVPDGLDLDKPLGTVRTFDDVYFNPYNYDGIEIVSTDEEPTSARFGLPVIYQLQTMTESTKSKETTRHAFKVHYSRIVHLAEGALDSRIEGMSALEPVWNPLIDSEKVRGGSGEAFFRNARQQRALEANKDAQLDPASGAIETLKENLEAFDNAYDSTLRVQNMSVKHLPVNLVSPRDTFDVSAETISGQTGIPIRILTGKGGGQTTGEEDRASWNALIFDRRVDFCNGVLFQALEIFANASLIELPDDAEIEWQPQAVMNEKDQSAVNKTKAETLSIIVDAMNKPVGMEADVDTVLEAVGLEDIEIDESAIDDDLPRDKDDEELPDADDKIE